MSVLICKNTHTEGPGTIEDYLRSQKIHYEVAELSKGGKISGPDKFDKLIMMGGPMSVNDENNYPYIGKEEELTRSFISAGKKVLGICLGAQIMAKALGARVYAGAEQEIGWHDIELTGEALRDSCMMKLALHPAAGDFWRRFKVFHWHGETFDVPEGAVRLAGSKLYPNQAFKYKNAYAFQFHIEVKKEMIYDWLRNESVGFNKLKIDTESFYNVYCARAMQFYEMFFHERIADDHR